MLVIQMERLVALELRSTNTVVESHKAFIAAEKEILECEKHLSHIAALPNSTCHIQSAGKNLWRISSTTKPSLEVLVFMDEKITSPTRINWRQNFE
jgi:Tfp pilus assembly protein PilX